MLSQTRHSWLEVEQVGSVTVARLTRAELLDEQIITTTGEHLFALVDEMDCRRILLDLGNVRRLASAMLGKVIALHRKLKPKGGRLALCRVDPELAGIIRVLHLNRLFGIYGDQQEALQSLQ
jgi:anti-anti-sigma factor